MLSITNIPMNMFPVYKAPCSSSNPVITPLMVIIIIITSHLVRRPTGTSLCFLFSVCLHRRTQDVSFFQSFLSFHGPRRDSRASLFSFRSPAPDLVSQNEFADDENSIFDDNCSWKGSLFSPPPGERQGSAGSQRSFFSHGLFPRTGMKHSSVDRSGGVSLVGSLPSTPLGRLLPELRLDMFRTDANVRTHRSPVVCCGACCVSFLFSLDFL